MADGSGRSKLEVRGAYVVYLERDGAEVWRLPVDGVLMVAEHTSAGGRDDDYFLEFGTLDGGEPCLTECAVPADVDDFLHTLSLHLGGPLRLKLASTTVFASRVLWPPRLAGQPLFVQRQTVVRQKLARLRRRLFGGELEWVVSEEVFAAMREQRPKRRG